MGVLPAVKAGLSGDHAVGRDGSSLIAPAPSVLPSRTVSVPAEVSSAVENSLDEPGMGSRVMGRDGSSPIVPAPSTVPDCSRVLGRDGSSPIVPAPLMPLPTGARKVQIAQTEIEEVNPALLHGSGSRMGADICLTLQDGVVGTTSSPPSRGGLH